MPKMILIITIVVMLGSLFGAVSYLLKMSKTDLPIAEPVIETQCEIDLDCELVYVGLGRCPSSDSLIDDYECFNKDEAIKIETNKETFLCSYINFKLRNKYTCKCENGKCEKVKIGEVEEVVITTDKMEYGIGEEVKITIENNSDKEQKISSPSYVVEKFENDNWIEIKQVWCPCGVDCNMTSGFIIKSSFHIKSKDKIKFNWNQRESWCCYTIMPLPEKISKQVSVGIYRIKSVKIGFPDPENYNTIYSNEFTIKEKSAVDARCGEKVMGRGNFSNSCGVGYEFDLSTKKCVEKDICGYDSIESSFETLEECQEVCEKRECAKANEAINFSAGTDKNLPDICCGGLKGISAYIIENDECEIITGGSFLICMPCGNGICETINSFRENKCNCPEDCK